MLSEDRTNADEVVALYVGSDLNVDDFENAEWRKAQSVQIDRYWSGESAPAGRKAEARLLWSEEALHVRFFCNQWEPLVVNKNAQRHQKTVGLWDRDVCEIFLAPEPNSVERYFEFEAAPTGEWLDVAVHLSACQRESDWGFSSGMTTATQLGRDYLFTGMRIPWSLSIPQPHKRERWRVNLFRCVGKDPDRGYLSWQPTRTPEPLFHVPQAFGWLIFK
jgi:cellulose/xylan binding protein with CBM9 domain